MESYSSSNDRNAHINGAKLRRSLPSQQHNNLVAESDLEAACQAIKEAAIVPVVGEALTAHIRRIVQPVSDESFHVYKYQMTHFYQQEQECYTRSNSDKEEKESNSISNIVSNIDEDSSNDDDENEIDPALLLDQEAHHRVKLLRNQVREQAVRVSATRQAVLDRAAYLAQQQILAITSSKEIGSNDDVYVSDHHVQQQTEVSLTAKQKELLQSLKDSLQQLFQAMELTEGLPLQLVELSQTLTVVQSYLDNSDKENRVEQAIKGSPEPDLLRKTISDEDPMVQLQIYLDG